MYAIQANSNDMQHQFRAFKCGPLKLDELKKHMDNFEENKMSPNFRIVSKVSYKITSGIDIQCTWRC